MFTKRNHGITMRFFLWTAFYANLSLFIISIIWRMDFLIVISLMISLLLIIIHKKHLAYSSLHRLLPDRSYSVKIFFQYLQKIFHDPVKINSLTVGDGISKTSVQFSPNPDFSRKEVVLHSTRPVKVDQSKLKSRVGSGQCMKPYSGSILAIDVPDYSLLSQDMFKGLYLASSAGNFIINISDSDLDKCKNGNVVLKFSVDKYSEQCEHIHQENFIKKISSMDSVKAIEIVLGKLFTSVYTLSELMDSKNNACFNNKADLLHFVQKLRYLSGGKPIGIRIGIGDKDEFIKFIRLIHEKEIFIDFITLLGEDRIGMVPDQSANFYIPNSIMPLDYAVSFASEVLRRYGLKKEIKIWAAGEVENGFDLLKLISLGADKCISLRSARFFNQISDNYFFDDSETGVKSNTLFIYRNILREAVQLMEYAGFSALEQVNPKVFFQRINKSTIKSFDEVYFKSKFTDWGIFEDYIR